jgi:hypothetical protein
MYELSIDVEYINKLSSYLTLFHKVRTDVWNARCPICGDSKKKLTKKRFYIYLNHEKGYYSVKCHNCGYNTPFYIYLKEYFPELYKEYLLEKFPKKSKKINYSRFSTEIKKIGVKLNKCKGFDYSCLKTFADLPKDHPGRIYIENRKIPINEFYYTPSFIAFLEKLGLSKYTIPYEHATEPRIIIPFYRTDGLSTVFQARAFSYKECLRYITIKEHDTESKIYGLHRVDFNKTVYCTEGPIDSLMIPNCIAMSGISTNIKGILPIFIFDNEPRNIDVVKTIKKRIIQKYKVVIFPKSLKYKDLNDMVVKGGFTQDKLLDMIHSNTYSGHTALLELAKWRKV